MRKNNINGKLKKITKKQKIITCILTLTIISLVAASVILISADTKKSNDKTKSVMNVAPENNNYIADDIDKKNIENGDISIEPLSNTPYGIKPDSKLKLSSTKPIKEENIKKNLNFSPNKSYDIKKVSDKEYILSTNTPFENNEIVRVTYNKEEEKLGWAFQTIKKFNIASTHPSSESNEVPIDSGIEIQFTKEIGEEKLDDYFEIKPFVKGKFRYEKDKIIFVPEKKLRKGTTYEVTIKKGYSNSIETIQEDYMYSFMTERYSDSSYVNLHGTTEDLIYLKPDELQFVGCYFRNEYCEENGKINLTIYKYNDKDEFINGYQDRDNIDIDEYTKVLSKSQKYKYDVELLHVNSQKVIELQTLEEGYYFLRADIEGSSDCMFIEVSPYNAYTSMDHDKFMVWMVDGKNSNLVNGADVLIDNEKVGTTDENGLAFIDKNKKEYDEDVLIELKTESGNPLIIPLSVDDSEKDPNCIYWSYLYFDRGLYLPTDEINIFGFVQHREGKNINNVKVQMYNDKNTLMDEKNVRLSKIGTYETKFNINDYLYDYVRIHVVVDDEYIIEKEYVNIAKFKKPTYKIDTSVDKDFIMMGDSITYNAGVSFYEGTPAPEAEIVINAYGCSLHGKGTSEGEELKCNDKGEKELKLNPYKETDDWQPGITYINTSYNGLQSDYVSDMASFILFPRDIMIETKNKKISDEEIEITANISNVDLTSFDGKLNDYDSFRGKGVPSKEITVEIVEHYYEKKYMGKEYDYINKRSYDIFDYKYHEDTIDTIKVTTDDQGIAKFNFDRVKDKRRYEFIIRTKDSDGRKIVHEHDYSKAYYEDSNYSNSISRYSLFLEKEYYDRTYKKDDKMELTIKQGYSPIPERDNDKALILICKEGIIDYYISDDTVMDITYLEKYIPNASIYVIYFDGKSLHNDHNMINWIRYDYEDEELNINIETDKKDYKPGDKVKVKVSVADKNGEPISTDVNISVVDEAFFAICEDSTDALSRLYRDAFGSGILGQFTATYNTYLDMCHAECGGEGYTDIIRSKFKNTADFDVIKTDEKGIGYKELQLPDNLTSWRITCTAIYNDLKAGKEKFNINAKLPFFISSIVYDTYMEGDDIKATVNTGGTKLSKDDQIKFTCTIENEKGKIKETSTACKGHEYANIPIGKLEKGKYKITIMADTGKYKDGEQYDIEIKDSLHYFDVIKQENLKEDMDIISNNQYVNLTFLNQDLCDYFYSLLNLYYSSYSDRCEYVIVPYLAGLELNDNFNKEFQVDEQRCKDYVNYDGLYNDFVYGNNDARITANLISVGYIDDKEKQTNGLLQAARDENISLSENIAALWALSLLGEPVLLETNDIYNQTSKTFESVSFETMYMMLTLIENGELQKGKQIYQNIKGKYLKSKHESLYIDTDDAGNKYTAMMMVAAVKLGYLEDAKGMYDYVESINDIKYTTITERLYYLQNVKPKMDNVSFQYSLNGKTKAISLGQEDHYSLNLTPEQAEDIKFSNIDGNIRVIKDFIGTVKDVDKTDKYSIERFYTEDSGSEDIKQGQIVTVHLKVNVLDNRLSSFVIEDILPTGLTYLGEVKSYNNDDIYLWEDNEVRRTKINVYTHSSYRVSDTYEFEITYKAKAILAGEYIAEPVIIRDNMNNNITCGEKGSIKIK
ncbi:hypothetical protein SH1V18_07390 [Vallitalea longa]|uniref:Alpha-2-macroglobulin bait region domain-containing protein n=1 Tax=Vallitalea longa TaxID=2936439 RepID=A0A9W5Y878_9FIRM|nr:Ig-like domain-containing alpha-2-macroglobulin family protein [Vallitalea longa]GKX28259.1 hypothetical protein SH1V18_07390 [Vallitalea longa]